MSWRPEYGQGLSRLSHDGNSASLRLVDDVTAVVAQVGPGDMGHASNPIREVKLRLNCSNAVIASVLPPSDLVLCTVWF